MTPLVHISAESHVAAAYGLEEAIFLHALMFWYRTNRGDDRNYRDGRWWTYNSVKAFEAVFPWWNAGQIRRIVARCREKGALLVGDYNQDRRDRTAWYTPSDELLELYGENENCICRKQQMQSPKSSNSAAENGKCYIRKPCSNHVVTDMDPPLPPAPEPQDLGFGAELNEAFAEWLAYKAEKRQAYRPTGLKALVSQVKSNAERYGGERVAGLIRQCMSANWQGIIWDKLAEPAKTYGSQPARAQPDYQPDAGRIRKNSDWLDGFLAEQEVAGGQIGGGL